MNPGPTGPWRRLVPLTVLVLAAHLVLLQRAPRHLAPAREEMRFHVRSVAAPAVAPAAAPAPVAVAPAVAPQPRPPQAPARRPAPRPGQAAQAQAQGTEPLPAAAPSQPVVAVAILPPARLHYQLEVQSRGTTLTGQALLEWRHDGQDYEARLELTAPGFRGRSQRSTGRITAQGLAPAYFADRYRGEQATHFDRAQDRVVFSSNRPEAALVEGMQDRLSVVLQLAALVAGDPGRFAPGTQVAVPTAGTREAEPWIFTVHAEEDLALPGGTVRALKLQKDRRREYDQRIELWLAPRMAYAPVRLRLTNPDGGAVEQRWASTDRP
ncbi:MAG TPA: DUF3108 domain-containing protein [Ramlibacter sp.]|nr:DUF3108 domain-containing protein [Ramlibacter sp.]